MVLVAYKDAMCKSHSQTSLLRNTNIEIVQACTYSHSRAGELGTRVQALAQNSLVPRPVPLQHISGFCTQTQT